MKEPWQWEEGDIETLIRTQRGEDLSLEYKRSDALAREERKKTELTKDVSAMANSAGGVIIYGIDEQKKTNGPIQLDIGIDLTDISREWIEQVIDSGIRRRIEHLNVHTIKMSRTGKHVHIIWVPQSNRAPHMAADHRYHKRLGTITAFMEEYEIRDVARRSESPDLTLEVSTGPLASADRIEIRPRITNRSAEPAYHASIRVYAEESVELSTNAGWDLVDGVNMIWHKDKLSFGALRMNWSAFPLLEGEWHNLPPINIGCGQLNYSSVHNFRIGWEIRTPKAEATLCGLRLIVARAMPHIDPNAYSLEMI